MKAFFRIPVYSRGVVVAWSLIDSPLAGAMLGRRWYRSARDYATNFQPAPRRVTYMHRVATNAPAGLNVDHANGNTYDNRLDNLRVCTTSQNMRNTRKRRAASSRFKGVSWESWTQKWRAVLDAGGKRVSIGRFESEKVAAMAYDSAAREHYKEFATLNFPREGERGCHDY